MGRSCLRSFTDLRQSHDTKPLPIVFEAQKEEVFEVQRLSVHLIQAVHA